MFIDIEREVTFGWSAKKLEGGHDGGVSESIVGSIVEA